MLGELQRIAGVLRDASTDPEISSSTIADLPPVSASGQGDSLDILPSVEFSGRAATLVSAVRTLSQALAGVVPITSLSGSVQRYGEGLTLEIQLSDPPGPVRRRLMRGQGPQRAASWHLDVLRIEDVPVAVKNLAYDVFPRLTPTLRFRSAKGFELYVNALSVYLETTVRNPAEAPRKSEDGFRKAAEYDGNAISYFAAGAVTYARYQPEKNRDAQEYFRKVLGTLGAETKRSWRPSPAHRDDIRLRACALSGLANTQVMGVTRFKEGSSGPRTALEQAKRNAGTAIDLAPDLPVAHKAMAFALHQLSEASETPEGTDGADALRAQAAREYDRALELSPNYVFAANNLGNLHLEHAKRLRRAGDLPSAARRLEDAERALERALSHRHALCNLGELWIERARLTVSKAWPGAPQDCLERAGDYLVRAIRNSKEGGAPYPAAENLRAVVAVLRTRDKAGEERLCGLREAFDLHVLAFEEIIGEYTAEDGWPARNRLLRDRCSEFLDAARETLGIAVASEVSPPPCRCAEAIPGLDPSPASPDR